MVEVALVDVEVTAVRFVMVEVALFTRMLPVWVCNPVHVFALARLSPAMTAPVVGEIVRVASALAVTDDTAPLPPPTQVPLILKHPPVRLSPLAADEVAVLLVRFKRFAANPPVKVEVEVTAPDTLRKPCRVEVPVVSPNRVEVALPPM